MSDFDHFDHYELFGNFGDGRRTDRLRFQTHICKKDK